MKKNIIFVKRFENFTNSNLFRRRCAEVKKSIVCLENTKQVHLVNIQGGKWKTTEVKNDKEGVAFSITDYNDTFNLKYHIEKEGKVSFLDHKLTFSKKELDNYTPEYVTTQERVEL